MSGLTFGTVGAKEIVAGQSITPGVHEVKLTKVEAGNSPNTGTPYLDFFFRKTEAGDDVKDASFRIFYTEKTKDTSESRVIHIMTKVVTRQQLDSIGKTDSIEQYAKALNALGAGKQLRMKFTGKETVYQGNIKVLADLPLYPKFAEATMLGAEHPVVSAENSELTYDPEKNKYDLRKLPPHERAMIEPESEEDSPSSGASADF